MKLSTLLVQLETTIQGIYVKHQSLEKSKKLEDQVYKVIKRKFDVLFAKLKAEPDKELAEVDCDPFIELIKTFDNIVKHTNLNPSINANTPGYELCVAIASVLTSKITDAPLSHKSAILIANPSLVDTLTQRQCDRLAREPRHAWFITSDGYPVYVSTCMADALQKKGKMQVSLPSSQFVSTRELSPKEKKFVRHHSNVVRKYYDNRPVEANAIEAALSEINDALSSPDYQVESKQDKSDVNLTSELRKHRNFLFYSYDELKHWLSHVDSIENGGATILAELKLEDRQRIFESIDDLSHCLATLIPKNFWSSFLKGFNNHSTNAVDEHATLKQIVTNGESLDSTFKSLNLLQGKPLDKLSIDDEKQIRAKLVCAAYVYQQSDTKQPPKAKNGKPAKPADSTTGMIGTLVKAATETYTPQEKYQAAQVLIDFLTSDYTLGDLEKYCGDKEIAPRIKDALYEKGNRVIGWNSTLYKLVRNLKPWKEAREAELKASPAPSYVSSIRRDSSGDLVVEMDSPARVTATIDDGASNTLRA